MFTTNEMDVFVCAECLMSSNLRMLCEIGISVRRGLFLRDIKAIDGSLRTVEGCKLASFMQRVIPKQVKNHDGNGLEEE